MSIPEVVRRCREHGLDLSGVAAVGTYNREVDAEYRLPGDDDRLVVVIGNSRALWPHLAELLASDEPDPVDTYVEKAIGEAVAGMTERVIDIRFSHEPPPRRIAIQRLAHLAGLAWLSPSHLCVHPEFGPWIALRAAIVLDVPAPVAVVPLDPPCDCSTHCLPLLDRALAAGEPRNPAELRESWRLWLAMRDACPVGRRHRYNEAQVLYHYTGIRS